MPESAFEYLNSHSLLFLATASSSGDVHVAPMFYATEGKAIFFSAPDGSETAANLKQNPKARHRRRRPARRLEQGARPPDRGIGHRARRRRRGGRRRAVPGKFPHLGDAALHTHYWRLDADDVRYVHNDEGGNETFDSLGQTWTREKVD